MVNVDTRLLDSLTIDELGLSIHIAKRMNKDRTCFPSIKTLAKDTSWGIDKVQLIKDSLEQKGIIKIKKGGGRFANLYTVLTPYLGIYLGGEIPPGVKADSSTPENPIAAPSENRNQVLGNSTIDQLSIEHKYLSHDRANVFKILTETIFTEYQEYSYYANIKGTQFSEVENATIRTFLKKIYRAAAEILDACNALKRPLPDWRDRPGVFGTSKGEIDAFTEARDQIQAYADFCRLTGTLITKTPKNLPEKIMSQDWCNSLKTWVDDEVKKDKYDPAMDEEGLHSLWVMEMYYWQPLGVYECKRYNNRIVYAGREYLINK